ncbi:MAG: hypothetical protein EPO08_13540 [Rhodospirillaceae bacterium]|nr:MAG: hypothetical protein EPO08_13540 [Rhodospirillaceae bacterium]
MSDTGAAKPWLAGTAAGVVAAADKLKQENPVALFTLLTRAAASGDWEMFLPAFERASGVRGLKLLLPAPNGLPMRYAYESACLPAQYWPVFISVLEVAAAIAHEAGDKLKAGKRLRDLVLERAFAVEAVRDLPFAAELAQQLAA